MYRVLATLLIAVFGALALAAGPPLNLKRVVEASDRVVLARVLSIRPTGESVREVPSLWGKVPIELTKCRLTVQEIYDLTANAVSVSHLSIDALAVGPLCEIPLPINGVRTVILFLKQHQGRLVLTTTLESSVLHTKPYANQHWLIIHTLQDNKERYGYAILNRWASSQWPKYSRLVLSESLQLQAMLGFRRYFRIAAVQYENVSGSERERLIFLLGASGVCLAKLQQILQTKVISGADDEFPLLNPVEASRFADSALEILSVDNRAGLERMVFPLDGYDLLHWYACVSIPEVATKARGQLESLYSVTAASLVCPPCR